MSDYATIRDMVSHRVTLSSRVGDRRGGVQDALWQCPPFPASCRSLPRIRSTWRGSNAQFATEPGSPFVIVPTVVRMPGAGELGSEEKFCG